MVVIHFQFHVKLESLKMKSVEIKSTAAQPPCSALLCTVWPRFGTAALLLLWLKKLRNVAEFSQKFLVPFHGGWQSIYIIKTV